MTVRSGWRRMKLRVDFRERLQELNVELERLNAGAHVLEERIARQVRNLLEADR